MIDGLLFTLAIVAALGCGLMAGFFFAFSVAVMNALARLSPARGIAAMQSIDVAVINPLFMAAFFGTVAACIVLAAASLTRWDESRTAYVLVGSGLYLVGAILVTIVCNVPRNDALAAVDPDSAEGASQWARYLAGWTTWNHVRAAASLAAAGLLTMALG